MSISGSKIWRESASLILVAKTTFAPNKSKQDYNYKLLTLKRSSKAGFMPGTYVFPGGVIEKADGLPGWLNLYERFGFKQDSFAKINIKENRTNIFQQIGSEIPKYLSLRIGAIRETFEECGILICRSYKINYKERSARWASFIGGFEMEKWQKKVHDDPSQFLTLCKEYEIYPDVWALKEWSNWVTPPSLPSRFDTIFFLAAFDQMPPVFAEKSEVQHLEWASPKEYLVRNKNEEIMLPPPQFYEVSRMRNFKDIEHALNFASERSVHGLERYFPYRINTADGVYSILPGDDLYPEEVDPNVDSVHFMSCLADSKISNRIQHKTVFNNNIIITPNFKPKFKHVPPVALDAKNKL